MKRIKSRIISALIVAVISIGLVGIAGAYKNNDFRQNISASKEEITWVQNEDGSYTFTNNAGAENSIYAWYVLDENGEAVLRTKYSDSPEFTYDLGENKDLIIKGFIRTGTEEEYDQTSMKVYATDILGPIVYSVKTVNLPEMEIEYLLDEMFPEADRIILVMDNLNTHKPASLYKVFPPAEARRIIKRLEIHCQNMEAGWI